MSNNFPPTVQVTGGNVELGDTILLSSMFEVSDVDPDSEVTKIRFRDSSTAATSGVFIDNVTGTAYAQGQVIEIDYSDLYRVSYRAAPTIGGELISVEAYDGLFWSEPGTGSVFSVVPNVNPPIVVADDFLVVATESVSLAPFVDAFDPDGYPILEYMFVNRSQDIYGGKLIFNGMEMPDATWFPVAADELEFLSYRGALYGKGETISVVARDEGAWSSPADMVGTTKANQFNPTVTAVETSVVLGQAIPAAELFVFNDLDPNTMKMVGFIDQGVASDSGYFTVDGVVQTAGQLFWVDAADINSVIYNSGSNISVEQFSVQASDGQRLSAFGIADATTVDVPILTTDSQLYMLDMLEQVQLASLVNVSQSNLSALYYEVIDMNPEVTSASLVVNGVQLEAGEVHRINAADWPLAFVQGGLDDLGRSLDEFNVRMDNGQQISRWSGVNFSTDPVNERALLEIGHWQKSSSAPLELTFNFPSAVPAYFCSGGFEECGTFERLADPGMRAGIRGVLDVYEDMFDVRYTEVSSGVLADVSFGINTEGPDGAAAYAYSPGSPGLPGQFDFNADVFGVKSSEASLAQGEPGEIGYFIWTHEMGHSHGLAHPFDPLTQDLPASIDNSRYTVMSYTDAPEFGSAYPSSPMLYDVMAMQSLYGANTSYRAGNTQIKFDRAQTNPQIVYDSGGVDTFNLNNHFFNSTIDLRQGQFSTVTGTFQNVGIAWGTEIENARGGQGNDTIIGNEGNNSLIGNVGDDTLRGGGGVDYLHGNEGRDVYEWFIGDGNDVINERFGAGRDSLDIHLFDEYVFDDDGNDPLGGNTLVNNFEFLKVGDSFNDLEVRLTLDGLADDGQIVIEDMGWGRNRVETLRLYNYEGEQVGPDISLRSVFDFATSTSTPFQITSNTSNYGNLAQPVV
ncbi:MAG: hypothetical protein GY819_07540 [Planctomycetaceae bacterium]|nr:hypothetical protein [Planctomycetaceae bacterium]MCP4462635.1 hypothetical protein [Planctomycetaceae bacterium]